MHVEHHVEAELPRPPDGLGDLGEVGLAVHARLGLEEAPVDEQPHGVEPERGDPLEVGPAERQRGRYRRIPLRRQLR